MSNIVPAVGSPEWDALTNRRAELIRKRNRDGLTDGERAELDSLQRLSRDAIAAWLEPCQSPDVACELRPSGFTGQ